MAKINGNYDKLGAGYLFPEIGRRVRQFLADNSGVQVMRLGIGNTTEALTPTVVKGLKAGVDKLADVATYSGYADDSSGESDMKDALQQLYKSYGVDLDLSEIFVSDGAKPSKPHPSR